MTRISLKAVMILSLTVLLPRISHAAQSYDNCTGYITTLPAVITTQGTWCMNAELATAMTSGTAIAIGTNNVIIDCNDFKLSGYAAGPTTTAYGIGSFGRSNTTVRHCNIRGFYGGIYLQSSGGGDLIEDNRVEDNILIGIGIDGSNGTIRRNLVGDTGDYTGVATPASAYGIYSSGSADIVDNSVYGVAGGLNENGYGIRIDNPGGSVLRNRVRGIGCGGTCWTTGIQAVFTGRVSLRDNEVTSNGTDPGGKGLVCADSGGRAKGNAIKGFAIPIQNCGNDGNVTAP